MAFHRQSHCSLTISDGFTGVHEEIEIIKKEAKRRQYTGARPRTVDFVTRPAKAKHGISSQVLNIARAAGKDHILALQHWALRIGWDHFELHRNPEKGRAEFVKRDWDEDREASITSERTNFGLTFMSDEEILKVGNHLIDCWWREYAAITNNCQILLIEVCRACLVSYDTTLNREWAGSKLFDITTHVVYPSVGFILNVLGCPEDIFGKWTIAFRDWSMGVMGSPLNDSSRGYHDLKNAFLESSDPFAAMEEEYIRRLVMGVERTTAILSHLPGVGRHDEGHVVTNLKSRGQKWTNRLAMCVGPGHTIMTASSLLRDAAILAFCDGRVIKDTFVRRKEMFGEYLPIKAAVQCAKEFVTMDSYEIYHSFKSFLLKLKGIMEILNCCWTGAVSLHQIAIKFRDLLRSENVSWRDCMDSLPYFNRSSKKARYRVTKEERTARRVVTFTMHLLRHFGTGLAFTALLGHFSTPYGRV